VPTFDNPSLKTNHLTLSYPLNCESSAKNENQEKHNRQQGVTTQLHFRLEAVRVGKDKRLFRAFQD